MKHAERNVRHEFRAASRSLTDLLPLVAAFVVGGCATYAPPIDPPTLFIARAEMQSVGDIRVSAVVLGDEESEQTFAARLAKKDVQPIWIQVENRSDEELAVNYLAIDSDYFAPAEVASRTRRFRERRSEEKIQFFYEQQIPLFIAPQSTVTGYVFANHDPGAKAFTIGLLSNGEYYSFDFAMLLPGFSADFLETRPDQMYEENELVELDNDGLREYLEALPCCVLGGDQETPGDPLNIVIVGAVDQLFVTLVRRGWDLTETMRRGTAWRTATSSVFGARYRTSPVSPLYLFDRAQDVAFQKARRTVDERNHMRLWRAPVSYRGVPVWVGQISRDIGVKFSSKTFVTHRIDSVVDEARIYLVLDMLESHHLAQFGLVSGVGVSTTEAPRYNYTDDPYFTDGLRAVMFLSDTEVAFDDLVSLEWELQPRGSTVFVESSE